MQQTALRGEQTMHTALGPSADTELRRSSFLRRKTRRGGDTRCSNWNEQNHKNNSMKQLLKGADRVGMHADKLDKNPGHRGSLSSSVPRSSLAADEPDAIRGKK